MRMENTKWLLGRCIAHNSQTYAILRKFKKKQIMDKRKFNKGKKGVAGNKPKFSPEFGKAKRKMISIPSLKEGEVMKGVDEILKPYLFDKNVKKLLK